MSTYLLLRDNKETGPYSLDDLKIKGLKAYDLVWIEGKSAAWRYPSEVEELKSFAPIVEEQPFDRFYKKTAQNNSSIVAQANPSIGIQTRPVPEKENSFSSGMNGSVLSDEPSSVPGKRIIYVTLPAGKSSTGMKMPSYREPARVQVSIPTQETSAQPNEKEPVKAALSSLYVKPAEPAEEKFSQDPDDLWKTAVELTPRQNGRGMKRILQPVAAIVCILALLAAGIFIGLSIKSDPFGFSQKNNVKEIPVSPAPLQHDPDITETASAIQAATPVPAARQPDADAGKNPGASAAPGVTPVSVTSSGITPSVEKTASASGSGSSQKKRTDRARDNRSSTSAQKAMALSSLPARDSAALSLSVLHREATHRTDEPILDKDAMRANISNLVSVGTGKYSVGTFGGITDLQLTVSNHSIYPIDLVVVEVQYIQANKKVFKTEDMYFRDLGPGSAMMQVAPKSSRGIRVQYKVTLINSKEPGLSYSGI